MFHQVIQARLHFIPEIGEEECLVVDPGCCVGHAAEERLVNFVDDLHGVVGPLLRLDVSQIVVLGDGAHSELLLALYHLLVVVCVHNFEADNVVRVGDVESQNLLPLRLQIVGREDGLGVLDLLGVPALVDRDLDHGDDLLLARHGHCELTLVDEEGQSGALHDLISFNVVASAPLLELRQFGLHLLDFFFHSFDVLIKELNVVFAVFERFKVEVQELFLVNFTVLIDIHFLEYLF